MGKCRAFREISFPAFCALLLAEWRSTFREWRPISEKKISRTIMQVTCYRKLCKRQPGSTGPYFKSSLRRASRNRRIGNSLRKAATLHKEETLVSRASRLGRRGSKARSWDHVQIFASSVRSPSTLASGRQGCASRNRRSKLLAPRQFRALGPAAGVSFKLPSGARRR